jgi:hypothetical protein
MSKAPKTKVISARVSAEIADFFEAACSGTAMSKSETLSLMIFNKYSHFLINSPLTPLEKLLNRLKGIIDVHFFREEDALTVPAIITTPDEDDEHYGKLEILIGDDTVVRADEDKFYILDYNKPDAKKELFTADEICDYYTARDLPHIHFPYDGDSYSLAYRKGYYDTAKFLVERLKEFIDKNS